VIQIRFGIRTTAFTLPTACRRSSKRVRVLPPGHTSSRSVPNWRSESSVAANAKHSGACKKQALASIGCLSRSDCPGLVMSVESVCLFSSHAAHQPPRAYRLARRVPSDAADRGRSCESTSSSCHPAVDWAGSDLINTLHALAFNDSASPATRRCEALQVNVADRGFRRRPAPMTATFESLDP